jgi:hypothetical protein
LRRRKRIRLADLHIRLRAGAFPNQIRDRVDGAAVWNEEGVIDLLGMAKVRLRR